MAEYVSFKDIMQYPIRYDHYGRSCNIHFVSGGESVLEFIEYLPRVQLVFCKDCEFQAKGENELDAWNICRLHRINVDDDFFCGKGLAKGDGHKTD